MLAGLREIAIITTPEDQEQFRRLLKDGAQWGMRLEYVAQPRPEGLAQAYVLAEDFLAGAASTMVLGDNIFFGHDLPLLLKRAGARREGGTVFGYHVADPERYGVVEFDKGGRVLSIEEKPAAPEVELRRHRHLRARRHRPGAGAGAHARAPAASSRSSTC